MLFTLQGLTAFFVTYLVDNRGFDQQIAAAMLSLLFVSGAVSQVAGGTIADRVGARWVLVVAAGIGTVAVGVIPFVNGLIPISVLSVVLGSRLAIAPVSNAYIIAILPESVTGTAWGILRTLFFLIGATGSTVVGVMADRGLFDGSFFLLAGMTAVAAVLYLFLPSRRAPIG